METMKMKMMNATRKVVRTMRTKKKMNEMIPAHQKMMELTLMKTTKKTMERNQKTKKEKPVLRGRQMQTKARLLNPQVEQQAVLRLPPPLLKSHLRPKS